MENDMLTPKDMLDIYHKMLLIRASELKMCELFKKGDIAGHMLPCLGQEAIPAALSKVYAPDDYLITAHRGGGHYMAKGCDFNALWAELFGRSTGVTKGRGGQIHLMDMSYFAMTGNAIVGQHWGIAVGAGFVARKRGKMVVAVGGEGSTNRGIFHESLNMAAVQKLPILYIVEFNNKQMWNTSTETTAGMRIADRALTYCIPSTTVDGNDPVAVYTKAVEFSDHIRNLRGPCLLECITAKWTDSVSNVREVPEVVEQIKRPEIDPIPRFEVKLRSDGILDDVQDRKIKDQVQERLQFALAFAQNSPKPDPSDGITEVYSQPV
jgi:acetoin:2,6-dichlorophenolindophenol oxidoreductase subunit alpha